MGASRRDIQFIVWLPSIADPDRFGCKRYFLLVPPCQADTRAGSTRTAVASMRHRDETILSRTGDIFERAGFAE
jgi:hypothetical protein